MNVFKTGLLLALLAGILVAVGGVVAPFSQPILRLPSESRGWRR